MTSDADAALDRPLPITIRPERGGDQADVAAITEVVTAAFGSAFEGGLPSAIRASANYIAACALVAVHGERIVGHVMVSYVDLCAVDAPVRRVPSLSPLAVAPEAQGRGVGRALVCASVAAAESRGEPLIVLEGSPRYYGALGFEPSVPYGISIDLPDWAPPTAAQLVRLSAYDAAITGTVVYPEYFDRSQSDG